MISIIVCTYNREKYILQCLESIANQSADRAEWELIIVNNKSTDETDGIVRNFLGSQDSDLKAAYFIEENQGLSHARNRGINESSGSFYVFVDDDAFLNESYILNLIKHLKAFDDLKGFGFGGRIYPFLESELPKWMSKYLMPLMSVMDRGDHIKEYAQRQFPIGANMGVSRSIIDQIGDFNVNLGRTGKNMLGGEEKDLFFRMRAEGYKVYYFPDVIVQHVVPDARLTHEFVKKQASGIGISERLRIKNAGFKSRVGRTFHELYKWVASCALFWIYLLTARPAKAAMIIRFR